MKKREDHHTIQDENKNETDQSIAEEQNLPAAEQSEGSPEAKLELHLSEARDKYLRLYSDFENYKKRIARDRIESAKMAGADVFLSILPVIDDIERAVKAGNETDDIKAIREGLALIFNKLKSGTEAKGLKAMETIGKPFDPDLHDAITTVPSATEDMKGKVVDEIEKGYYLNDKVIRHAKVVVGG